MTSGRKQASGFVLLAVTVVVIGLSLVTLGLMRLTTQEAVLQSSVASTEQFRLSAEAASELVIYDLFADPSFDVSDTTRSTSFSGQSLITELEHQDGLIDINLGDEDLISAVFRYTGSDDQTARAIAAAIIDWRDADAMASFDGAELADYQNAGLSYGPRNGPFEKLGELLQVLPMTRGRYLCALPFLTVYSDTATIDFDVAPDKISELFTWADSVSWAGRSWTVPPPASGTTEVVRSDGSGSSLRLTTRQTGPDAPELRYSAVVRLVQTARAPFELLEMRVNQPIDTSDCQP